MSNKTPYEIRLELLKLSNEILSTQVFQQRDARIQEFNSKLTDQNRDELQFPVLPDLPSINDVITQAERLNEFISQK